VIVEPLDHDLLNLWKPEVHDGDELDPLAGFAVIEELARHDSAVGWCSYTLNISGVFAGRCDVEACGTVFGGRQAVVAGLAAPAGRARPVDGGLVVTGRWPWGSGIHAATAVGGGVLVDDDGPRPRDDGLLAAWVFVERDQVEVLDTWRAMGVRGSGSTDYEVHDVFVPEGRWMPLIDPPVRVDRPLFHMPLLSTTACGIAAVALGILDRAIEEFVRLADGKVPQGRRRTLAHRMSAQIDVAQAEATLASARAFVHDAIGAAWATVDRGHEVSTTQRRMMRLAASDAVQRAAHAVLRLHRSAGGTSVYETCPLERLFRDAHTLTQHQGADEAVYETVGRLALGVETETTML
jgi:indole-3-acetate monooxygenase